jgi:hypothetical protein
MLVDLGSVNWWAVLVSTVIAYLIGAVWYAPPVFGDRWMSALGSKAPAPNRVKPMIAQFFLTLVIAAALAAVVVRFGAVTWIEGAAIGVALSIAFVATSLFTDWMFCGLDLRLYWIQVGYRVLLFAVVGAILGAWR